MVYIEYAIINNLLANSVILGCTAKVSGIKRSKKNLFTATLVGTFFGVFLPTIAVTEILCAVIKILTALLLTFLITGKTNLKKYVITLLIFYGVSFCLGGTVNAIVLSLSFQSRVYTTEELTFCIVAGGVIFIYIAGQILSYISGRTVKGCVTVYLLDKSDRQIACDAFVDSGNGVTYRGFGVHFIPSSLKSKLKYNDLSDFVSVTTTIGTKMFPVYAVPQFRYSDGREEECDVPVIFWETGRNEEKIILHRGR